MADGRSSSDRPPGPDGVALVRLDRPKANALSRRRSCASWRPPPRSWPTTRPGPSSSGAASGSSPPGPTSPSSAAPTEAPGHRPASSGPCSTPWPAIPRVDHRRRHRLRPRRRLRAGAGLRPPGGGRQRQVRPARDPARHHPGRGRHPAADPPGRAVPGQGPGPDRPPGRTPTRRLRIGLADRVVPADRGLRHGRRPGPPSLAAGAVVAQGLAKRAIDAGLDGPLGDGPRPRGGAVRRGLRDRGRSDRGGVVPRRRPGKARFVGR